MRTKSIRRRAALLSAASAAFVAGLSIQSARADSYSWAGPQNTTVDWYTGSDWYDATTGSYGQVPPAGSYVYLPNAQIDFSGTYGSSLQELELDGAPTYPTVTPLQVTQTGGAMKANTEIIGGNLISGSKHGGDYLQKGGINSANTLELAVGDNQTKGFYEVEGNGVLDSTDAYIGVSGADAQFSQGADNLGSTAVTFGDLEVGVNSGSTGFYGLVSGTLNASTTEIVGSIAGLGGSSFEQYGGSANLGIFQLGSYYTTPKTNGELDAGTLTTTSESIIDASAGYAYFYQMGGTNSTNTFTVDTSTSQNNFYELDDGTLTVNGNEYLGYSTNFYGRFTQYGGNNTVGNGSQLDDLILGYGGSATGTYGLIGGTLSIKFGALVLAEGSASNAVFVLTNDADLHAPWEYDGEVGTATFTQSGGTHQVDSFLSIGTSTTGQGTYLLQSGTLSVGGGGGTNGIFLGDSGTGTINQSGGVLNSTVNLYVGYNTGSTGTFTMSAGSATISPGIAVGYQGTGTVSQTGGSIIIPSSGTWISIGDLATGGGSYTLGGGATTATLSVPAAFVGDAGQGTLTVDSNGTLACSGALTVGNSSGSSGNLILNGGAIGAGSLVLASAAGSAGSCVIWGGTLTVANAIRITNAASMVINGGTVISQADENVTASNTITSISQYSGSNTVAGTIYLDTFSGMSGSGSYFLQGGTLSTGYEQVGVYGYGYFAQAGGNETINNFLIIGNHAGSFGQLFWNGPGNLQISGSAYVGGYFGNGGSGEWVQSGGTGTVGGGVNLYSNSVLSINGGAFSDSGTINNSNHSVGLQVLGGAANFGALTGSGNLQIGNTTNTYGMGQATVSALQENLLTITRYGSLQITGGTSNTLNSLLIDNTGGVLDITNTHLFINYGSGPDPITSIAAYLASGFNGGAWNGPGINSSTAAANYANYALGYADSADPGNPAALSSGQIEIKYTLLGDANLDGVVNGIDFGILAANFNKSVSRWDQGDFNYDNIVNGIDFADLAANFNKGASGASALSDPAIVGFAQANGLMADVPEPACGAFTALAVIGALTRRRRPRPDSPA